MDEASVLLSDLEEIKASLSAAHKQNEAWDIFDSYRKLNNRFQWSAMTRSLENCINKVTAYIDSAAEETEE